jgi:hypothetical protein
LDKIVQYFSLGKLNETKMYCKLLNLEFPENLEQAINIYLMFEMTKLGMWISRDILNKFPNGVPIYFDFRQIELKEQQFCTDSGRLLWTFEIEKRDCRIICESKNRYK